MAAIPYHPSEGGFRQWANIVRQLPWPPRGAGGGRDDGGVWERVLRMLPHHPMEAAPPDILRPRTSPRPYGTSDGSTWPVSAERKAAQMAATARRHSSGCTASCSPSSRCAAMLR